jgi:hypothetical protein
MHVEIIDVSEMKETKQPVKRYDIKPIQGEKCITKKVPMELLPKDMVYCEEISCERTKKGMTDNCALCQHINGDIFIKCQTKYK